MRLSNSWEPYGIPEGTIVCQRGGEEQLRALCKLGVMCILYAKTKRGAISAIIDKIKNDKNSFNLLDMSKPGSYSNLIEALINSKSSH